jgi:hypothetical protein
MFKGVDENVFNKSYAIHFDLKYYISFYLFCHFSLLFEKFSDLVLHLF